MGSRARPNCASFQQRLGWRPPILAARAVATRECGRAGRNEATARECGEWRPLARLRASPRLPCARPLLRPALQASTANGWWRRASRCPRAEAPIASAALQRQRPVYVPHGIRSTAPMASLPGTARDFHGRLTANGEVYDMHGISAAHPTLPLPSYARVTNLDNGRSIVVRVNDRGPYTRERIIDLSIGTAKALKFLCQRACPRSGRICRPRADGRQRRSHAAGDAARRRRRRPRPRRSWWRPPSPSFATWAAGTPGRTAVRARLNIGAAPRRHGQTVDLGNRAATPPRSSVSAAADTALGLPSSARPRSRLRRGWLRAGLMSGRGLYE